MQLDRSAPELHGSLTDSFVAHSAQPVPEDKNAPELPGIPMENSAAYSAQLAPEDKNAHLLWLAADNSTAPVGVPAGGAIVDM